MTRKKDRPPGILVLLTDHLLGEMMTPGNQALLESVGEATFAPQFGTLGEAEYAGLFNGMDAVVTGWGVRGFPDDLLERAPELRIIAHAAGSVRFIPRNLLEHGIVVTTAKGAIAPTVGEMCLLLAIAGLRRLRMYERDRDGRPAWQHPGRPQASLFDKRVGLVGFGDTAREFRALLEPFRCPVSACDPYVEPEQAAECRVELRDLESLLRESDVVSLHVPGLPETRHMIGKDQLRLIRDGAVLINTARGAVIDTDALTAEAASGRFQVGLDVSEPEPLPEGHPLWSLPNVTVHPHIAGPTRDHLPNLLATALRNLKAFFEGQTPPNPVSIETYDRISF
jgi:phosphoglycerate dehydrogenase-like enzyme